MAERRQPSISSSRVTGVRRNLFHHHLSRRPTTTTTTASSASTSHETLRSDAGPEFATSDIVVRDRNGDFDVVDSAMHSQDDKDEVGFDDMNEDEKERQRLTDAVKNHQRDRNRAPSEPAELLEAVKASLRAKTAALAEDSWMYEAEDDPVVHQ